MKTNIISPQSVSIILLTSQNKNTKWSLIIVAEMYRYKTEISNSLCFKIQLQNCLVYIDLIIYIISPTSCGSCSAIIYKINIIEHSYTFAYNCIRQWYICISLQNKTYSGHKYRVSCGILILISLRMCTVVILMIKAEIFNTCRINWIQHASITPLLFLCFRLRFSSLTLHSCTLSTIMNNTKP